MAQTTELGRLLVVFLETSWNLVRRHFLVLLGAAALVALGMTLFSAYRSYMTQHIVVLGGPAGGSGSQKARQLADYLEMNASTLWGRHYVVRTESTGGYSENVKRIQLDKTGRSIGFGHDGFEDVAQVKSLLPLDRQFLHVICSKRFYKVVTGNAVSSSSSSTTSIPKLSEFEDFLISLPKGQGHKVYLGPHGSGTRWAAERVLRAYRIDPSKFVTHGVANWYELGAAFNSGSIDLAFMLSPKDAESVVRIADDNETILLSIDYAETVSDFNNQLTPDSFPDNSYSSTFCHGQLQTVSAKRVVACSEFLDASDAYFLARHVQRAMGISHVGWSQDEEGIRGYGLHPGAALLQDNKKPDWIENFNYVWVTFGVWIVLSFVTELARKANNRIGSRRDKSARPPLEGAKTDATLDIGAFGEEQLETLGERLADTDATPSTVSRFLNNAITGVHAAFLADKVRSGYLDVVSRFAEQEPKAQAAIADVIRNPDAPTSLRKEAIKYASELGIVNDDLSAALHVAKEHRSLKKEATIALEKAKLPSSGGSRAT